MPKFRKKPVEIEAITFEELVEHGRTCAESTQNGMPWAFKYKGYPITHENDNCYIIPTLEGTMRFERGDMLITGVKGEIYPCKLDIFAATYSLVDGSTQRAQVTQERLFDGPQYVCRAGQSNAVRTRNYIDVNGFPAGGYVHGPGLCVSFQDGPRGKGPDGQLMPANGAFVEDLLVGALQRLEFFQASKFNHARNQEAIDHIVAALAALQTRAEERKTRGVLGANVV